MKSKHDHTFHIPVMGLAFTIDTPVKVARFGISSVLSLIEDQLIEQMRKVIIKNENLPYSEITTSEHDYRAKRITTYLNLLNQVVNSQTEKLRNENFEKDKDNSENGICHFFILSHFSALPSITTFGAKLTGLNEFESTLVTNIM